MACRMDILDLLMMFYARLIRARKLMEKVILLACEVWRKSPA